MATRSSRFFALAALLLAGASAERMSISLDENLVAAEEVKVEDTTEGNLSSHSALQVAARKGDKSQGSLRILSWNVKDVVRNSAYEKHRRYIAESLIALVEKYNPQVIFLQEIEKCYLLQELLDRYTSFECVESVAEESFEDSDDKRAFGNAVLYNAAYFEASHLQRARKTSKWKIEQWKDEKGKLISDHWDCKWKALGKGRGCDDVKKDFKKFTSVRLDPVQNEWTDEMYGAIKNGLRLISIHLWAGGRSEIKDGSVRLARRAFQFRSVMTMVAMWNTQDKKHHGDHEAHAVPTTIYAGDYNTAGKGDFKVVAAAGEDYAVDLFCPMEKASCTSTDSAKKSHPAGYFDHIAMDINPQATQEAFAHKAAITSKIVDMPRGDSSSDHFPIYAKFAYGPQPVVKQADIKPVELPADSPYAQFNAVNQQHAAKKEKKASYEDEYPSLDDE
mmetsp:Transcript_65096/g.146822  ORF Transcript_65096/g.146822 Transcript_65096/m.146822 type:complete len:447 (-) Transcript_65096:78-1418(-)